ncbi:MAG: HTH domain-containing protein, partial [candidate division Zixibacteria bacterium]|nr:HTH domain-containing protein [candidate division Zixibacteria bacterium]
MTKAERLFHIVRFLRVRGKADISELAEECSVSHRTVYRDILSLSELNVLIYYENGY